MPVSRPRLRKPCRRRRVPSVMLALCVSLATAPTLAVAAQPANENSPVAQLLASNPLLDEVEKASPTTLPVLVAKLEELAGGSRQGRSRAGLTPTPAEQAQLMTNPAFAQASRNNPDQTLLLLRSANELLRQQHSDTPASQGPRIALVIGNSHYRDWHWRELAGARADVELVANTLRRAGFTLIDGGPQLDLDNATLARDIAELRAASHQGTTSLLYFAGHGAQLGATNYLVPTDGKKATNLFEIRENSLDTLENRDGSIKIIVLDACRDEIVTRGYLDNPQGLARANTGSMTAGTFVIYSTAPDSVAIDQSPGQANSPFAAAFAREMMKPGVDIREMLEAVSLDVAKATSHEQTPWISHSASAGSFYFLPPGSRPEALAGLPPALPTIPRSSTRLSDDQLMNRAMAAHFAKQYAVEKPLLDEAVKRGIPGALYEIGFQYDEGVGREKNYRQAAIWYQRAADAGNAVAMNNLGILYQSGQGVPRDFRAALALFGKAAALGDERGMNNLGVAYENGLGVPIDIGQAETWYEKAAAENYPEAMTNLGALYWKQKRYREAFDWTNRAAKLGYAGAIGNIGGFYLMGTGVRSDSEQARKLFLEAANKGDYHSMANLARIYRDGLGVSRDDGQAFEWSQRAAEGGDVFGMQILAGLYSDGRAVPRDEALAMRWYVQAAEKGDLLSMVAAGIGFSRGFGVPRDCGRAEFWFRQAAMHGDTEAQALLRRGGFCS